MIRYWLSLLLVLVLNCGTGRDILGQDRLVEFENILEALAAQQEELDILLIADELYQIHQDPINLNEVTRDDLLRLFFLDKREADLIIQYRDEHGYFLSEYELGYIEGLDEKTIEWILPFITITAPGEVPRANHKGLFRHGRHQIVIGGRRILQEQVGYHEEYDTVGAEAGTGGYQGGPWKLYNRYQYTGNRKISYGVTMEKDAGEPFFNNPNRGGFDFNSGYIQYNHGGIIEQLNIGDFHVQYGEGLMLWTGFDLGKTSLTTNIRKRPRVISRYASSNELNYFRGVGIVSRFNKFRLSTFLSQKRLDASLAEPDSLNPGMKVISSFPETGYHRTPGEISKKWTARERVVGLSSTYEGRHFRLSASFMHLEYDKPVVARTEPYKIFFLEGKGNSNMGLHYHWEYNRLRVFGEGAIDREMAFAQLHGLQWELHSGFKLALLYRDYSEKYNAPYANAFSEGPGVKNESGFYFGTLAEPFKKLSLAAYFDTFKFPWLKYNADAPSRGADLFIESIYRGSENFIFRVRYRTEKKELNHTPEGFPGSVLAWNTTSRLRLHADIHATNELLLKSRYEVSRHRHEYEPTHYGYLLYQEIIYSPSKFPLSIAARIALFDIGNYNARIYTYESNLPYSFSIPSFSGKGIRNYINLRYSPAKILEIRFRLANTFYPEETALGSGLEEITGNSRTEISMMLKVIL